MKALNPIKIRFVKVPTTNPYSDEEVQQIMLKDATEGNPKPVWTKTEIWEEDTPELDSETLFNGTIGLESTPTQFHQYTVPLPMDAFPHALRMGTAMQMGRTAMRIIKKEGWPMTYEYLGAALNSLEVD